MGAKGFDALSKALVATSSTAEPVLQRCPCRTEALLAWFGGTSSEDQALAAYHERRNAHSLPAYRETVSLGRDLRQLAAA